MATKKQSQINGLKIKWSIKNKTWQIWKGQHILSDHHFKTSAISKAKEISRKNNHKK